VTVKLTYLSEEVLDHLKAMAVLFFSSEIRLAINSRNGKMNIP